MNELLIYIQNEVLEIKYTETKYRFIIVMYKLRITHKSHNTCLHRYMRGLLWLCVALVGSKHTRLYIFGVQIILIYLRLNK